VKGLIAKRPINHKTKPEANGKAALWQGYEARDGFGMTRIKNQMVAVIPKLIIRIFCHDFRIKSAIFLIKD
jgi:hypothetical protein